MGLSGTEGKAPTAPLLLIATLWGWTADAPLRDAAGDGAHRGYRNIYYIILLLLLLLLIILVRQYCAFSFFFFFIFWSVRWKEVRLFFFFYTSADVGYLYLFAVTLRCRGVSSPMCVSHTSLMASVTFTSPHTPAGHREPAITKPKTPSTRCVPCAGRGPVLLLLLSLSPLLPSCPSLSPFPLSCPTRVAQPRPVGQGEEAAGAGALSFVSFHFLPA